MSDKNIIDKKDIPKNLQYLTKEKAEEIKEGFNLLGIKETIPYPGVDLFTRNLRRAGILRYEGITFTTSGSSLSPFKNE